MSTLYGMAADHVSIGKHKCASWTLQGFLLTSCQVLAFEVVTPNGRFVTADAKENSDLYWALRGGGGGTFGVVTSVTVKTFPKLPITIMTFDIMNTTTTSDAFWGAIRAYWDGFVNYNNAGCYSYFFIFPNLIAEGITWFTLTPFWAPNMTRSEVETLVSPMFATFKDLGLNITPTYQEFDNFHDAWAAGFPLEKWGVNVGRQAARLWPKSNWDNNTVRDESFAAVRAVAEDGGWVFGFSIAPGNVLAKDGVYPDVAINPAWRRAAGHVINSAPWPVELWANETGKAKIAALSDKVTNKWTASWEALTPGSGAYHAEGDYMQPDWQQTFWGEKYPELLRIKQKYDPYELLYVHHGVGSENWKMDTNIVGDVPSQAGRLCRV